MKNYKIYVNGQAFDVSVEEVGGAAAPVSTAAPAARPAPTSSPAPTPAPVSAGGAASVKAPMPGTVLNVKVSAGQTVTKGQVLLILEAMKMENEICAPADGSVAAVRVQAGQSVNTGDPLVELA